MRGYVSCEPRSLLVCLEAESNSVEFRLVSNSWLPGPPQLSECWGNRCDLPHLAAEDFYNEPRTQDVVQNLERGHTKECSWKLCPGKIKPPLCCHPNKLSEA